MIVVFIIDDLLLAPARGLIYIFKEIARRVDEELYDEAGILKQLISLQRSLEFGEITEEEYEQTEEKLMERLAAARERQADQSEEE